MLASTIKDTIRSQTEVDRLMAQGIIITGKTQVTDRHFDIAPDVQCPTCAKWHYITLRCPNPQLVHCFLCAGLYLTKDYKCNVHGFRSKKDKTCSYTIARCCNCDGKHFASASACPKYQQAIETAK